MGHANRSLEIILGAMVVSAVIFFGAMLLNGRPANGSGDGLVIYAVFGNADGVDPGSVVKMSGVPVGRVVGSRLELPYYDAIVEIRLNPGMSLPDDSTAKVSFGSLLGGNFIELEPGGSTTMMLPEHYIEDTSDAVNLVDLISTAVFSAGATSAE